MPDDFNGYQQWLGIEPDERPLDHYRLLGLPRFESDRQIIATAVDERMARVRRHQTGPRGRYTQDILNRLASARICLLNPDMKAAYDRALVETAAPVVPPPLPAETRPHYVEAPPLPTPWPAEPVHTPLQPAVRAVSQRSAPEPFRGMPQPDARGAPPTDADEQPAFRGTMLPFAVGIAGILLALGIWAYPRLKDAWSGKSPAAVVEPESEEADESLVADSDPPPDSVANKLVPAPEIRVIQQEGDGSFNFTPVLAAVHGPTAKLLRLEGEDCIGDWRSEEDWLEWAFRVVRPAIFQVQISYALPSDTSGGGYWLELDGKPIRRAETRDAIPPGQWVTDQYFVPVTSTGEHRFAVRSAELKGTQLMILRAIRLVPRKPPGYGFSPG